MRVFVLNMRGQPLMPTTPRKARILLRDKKAKMVKRTPFTIQLKYATGEAKKPIILGVDAGSKKVGLSATTEDEELISLELTLRNDIVDLLSTRRQYRRARRNRLRYRKARFNNRVSTKDKGWLAPSINNKIDGHLKIISLVYSILPIQKIVIEVGQFDIQKIKKQNIEGEDYQSGEQLSYSNVREYVLSRDGYRCHGKKGCKNKILQVHHIESRKTGGNSPNNLITLCKDCHSNYHRGNLKLSLKRGNSFRDAAFMNITRWNVYNQLKEKYNNVKLTYGYVTKYNRIKNKLEKSHINDARMISNNFNARPSNDKYKIKQVRRHNRQIHKAKILKGGKKKLNQTSYELYGFRLFDKVKYLDKEYFIHGRRKSGYFDIRNLDGEKVNKGSLSYKNLKFLESRKTILIQKMEVAIPPLN